eukprot:5186932-Pleurochrysis_carterae.AAC.5
MLCPGSSCFPLAAAHLYREAVSPKHQAPDGSNASWKTPVRGCPEANEQPKSQELSRRSRKNKVKK